MNESFFRIDAAPDTPLVIIDKVNGKIIIEGVSMPENAYEFYEPIEKRILQEFENRENKITLEIGLSYMNSLSNKQLLKIIKKLAAKPDKLSITWKYAKDDELIHFKGEEIRTLCAPVEVKLVEVA